MLLSVLKCLVPSASYWRLLAWKVGNEEPEIQLLPFLCDKTKVSIDVGASGGSYAVHLVGLSKRCVAFEPIPNAAQRLRDKLVFQNNPRLQVESVAIGDFSGEANLRIPVKDPGRSTLAATNPVGELGVVECVTVPVKTLDEYPFGDTVGFVKIDVEGHEEAVLRGASVFLAKDRPALMIEIEERHNPGSIERVSEFLTSFGYTGYFLREGHLRTIDSFKKQRDQYIGNLCSDTNRRSEYINNFVFLTQNHVENARDWRYLLT